MFYTPRPLSKTSSPPSRSSRNEQPSVTARDSVTVAVTALSNKLSRPQSALLSGKRTKRDGVTVNFIAVSYKPSRRHGSNFRQQLAERKPRESGGVQRGRSAPLPPVPVIWSLRNVTGTMGLHLASQM